MSSGWKNIIHILKRRVRICQARNKQTTFKANPSLRIGLRILLDFNSHDSTISKLAKCIQSHLAPHRIGEMVLHDGVADKLQ